jgi:TonB-dependent SusC/RagA subfamily outer membrane receptor
MIFAFNIKILIMKRNKMKQKLFVFKFTIIALLLSIFTGAQDRVIHGIVTTFDSIPLINAEVKVLSSKQKVLTDTLGRFSVGSDHKDKLKVSAYGFYNQKVELNENTKFAAVNLKLKPGEKAREYAIGYGHVNDYERLNSLASLNNNDLDFSQYSNIYELIRGRFAGVQIINDEIIIRGQNSINLSSAALVVLDGVIIDSRTLNSISPIQVKSINVIKDGSAAIYGSRGANGVVIIETRRGND